MAGLPRPRGASVWLPTALAAALLTWSAAAQVSDRAAELEVPDLTVTAEDPLTLLPPLGPAPDDSPIALPAHDATRARYHESPPPPSASGAVPLPAVALQYARTPEALPRSSDLEGRVVFLDVPGLRALHAALLLATGAPDSEATLALAATAPLRGEGATRVTAHAGMDAGGGRIGLDLALAEAATGQLLQGRLAADSAVAAKEPHVAVPYVALTYARWGAGSRAALEALLGLVPLPPALEVEIGGAVALDAGAVSVFPAGRVTFAPAPDWHLEAGVRPAVGFPAWLLDPAGSVTDELELTPERAWLAWLGGGYGDLHLRLGVAHGLIHGFHGNSVGVVGTHAVLFLLALHWDTVARRGPPGDITLRVAAGAAATWTPGVGALGVTRGPPEPRVEGADAEITSTHGVVGRLLLEATWPVLATPPVAVLVRAGLLQAPMFGVEDWLAATPARLGLSAAAGLRWAPAHGHQLKLLAGVRGPSEHDLTVFAGIEYARNVVRLVAPPKTAAR